MPEHRRRRATQDTPQPPWRPRVFGGAGRLRRCRFSTVLATDFVAAPCIRPAALETRPSPYPDRLLSEVRSAPGAPESSGSARFRAWRQSRPAPPRPHPPGVRTRPRPWPGDSRGQGVAPALRPLLQHHRTDPCTHLRPTPAAIAPRLRDRGAEQPGRDREVGPVPRALSCPPRIAVAPAGRGPDDLKIAPLLERLRDGVVKEIILATNPTSRVRPPPSTCRAFLKPLGLRLTRIGSASRRGRAGVRRRR